MISLGRHCGQPYRSTILASLSAGFNCSLSGQVSTYSVDCSSSQQLALFAKPLVRSDKVVIHCQEKSSVTFSMTHANLSPRPSLPSLTRRSHTTTSPHVHITTTPLPTHPISPAPHVSRSVTQSSIISSSTTAKLSPLLLSRTVSYEVGTNSPKSGDAYRKMTDTQTGRRRRSSSLLYQEPPETVEQLSDQAALPNLNANWVNAKG